ncbi:trans-sulfuration enzyme family protein [Roseivirga pacifica]|uniref:trans-sulfuration enzyme family protein n=1 Tax=Roseivirga pacifica TaxID=1267423 RepID=UPI0020964DF8|nr:aminotransferase class I/II-fold pyridoxal phosphate-dependent enzyme [Roseivirga pacifica]MCO6360241.1 aminotransferase class I/II-fold pyridoxal phosphate-dependent enzyme [Roseivirga pacifica]MCO6367612.1 aminotransferase class I/II-fold pyridoxal phosphate-dependent enzyme [Roseivirga pacifica]MCO6369856.1 aminotransferase class I/II-fold pyridoxal phosphate-dependent enzyme [Roseivirga pacifica]MCO6375269.1 aminotransferase class I/II-fold pyridoxal phosphate-dependent enzyme [Roseivirg
MSQEKKFETQAIRTQIATTSAQEHATPLYLTSSFLYQDAEEMRAAFAGENNKNIYSRFTNPNYQELVDKVCLMEGAEAGYAFATGMSAIFSTFAALLSAGDHVVSCRSIFGSTHTVFQKIFPKWQIETTYVDIKTPASWQEAIQPNTKVLYVETPTNPGVDLVDLEWLGKFAKQNELILIVDNCFATPYLQQPIKYGADLVIHSATKFMDGQGRVMGGVTVGRQDLIDEVYAFSRSAGPAISPFNAWVISKSLETLGLRMDRHCDNALKLAQFLEGHERVAWVKYPFLPSHPMHEVAKKQMKAGGGMVSFGIKGGAENGKQFLNNIAMCSLTANLGDSRTIVTHPWSTTHAKLSEEERQKVDITPELIRVSTGLEHVDDIIADIDQALNKAF